MTVALAVLTDANPTTAFWVLVGCTASITVIAVVLAFVVLGQHRGSHNHAGDMAAAADALVDANAELAKATAWGARLAENNARMRVERQLPPMPPRRPAPEPEQTLTLPRDPHATQRIPAHQPPTRTARHGEGT